MGVRNSRKGVCGPAGDGTVNVGWQGGTIPADAALRDRASQPAFGKERAVSIGGSGHWLPQKTGPHRFYSEGTPV